MEFSTSSSDPIILQPGCEKHWGHPHALEDTLRWTETKQAENLPLRRSSVISVKRRANELNATPRIEKRRRINKPVIVTKQRSSVEKSRSTHDWERLLRSSSQRLLGLYQKMDVPVAPKTQVLGSMFPLSLVQNDPALVASKAMHHAAGCCNEGGSDADDSYESSSSESDDASDSDNISEGPATPDAMHISEDVDIDMQFTSGVNAGVSLQGAYSHLR